MWRLITRQGVRGTAVLCRAQTERADNHRSWPGAYGRYVHGVSSRLISLALLTKQTNDRERNRHRIADALRSTLRRYALRDLEAESRSRMEAGEREFREPANKSTGGEFLGSRDLARCLSAIELRAGR